MVVAADGDDHEGDAVVGGAMLGWTASRAVASRASPIAFSVNRSAMTTMVAGTILLCHTKNAIVLSHRPKGTKEIFLRLTPQAAVLLVRDERRWRDKGGKRLW